MAKGSVKNVKIFLSATTREFGDHRVDLASRVTRDNVEVKTQEELYVLGYTTLVKLDHYIAGCNAVVHLLGDSTGATPEADEVKELLEVHKDLPTKLSELAPLLSLPDPGISYTQWEAYLAIYHKRRLLIYRPTDNAPRTAGYELNTAEQAAQLEHYNRICAMGRDRGQFQDVKDLSANVLRDLVDVLAERDGAASKFTRVLGGTAERACESIQRKLFALHCSTVPRRREFNKSAGEFPMFWAWAMYRFFAVFFAIRVIWEFCFKLEDGSLYGLQQSAFLYAATAGNFLLIGWQQLETRFFQVVRLLRGGNWHGRKHELAAKGVDLCLMPLEITCVFAALPVAAEKILRHATQEGNAIALTLLGAATAALAVLHAGRHWSIYHHYLRRLRNGDFPAWALTLNWAVGFWFLFNPQLLPSGVIAEFHTRGNYVTHLAAGETSTATVEENAPQELAVASNWRIEQPTRSQGTTIEFVQLPGLTRVTGNLDGVPWDNRDLQQLTYFDGRLSAWRVDDGEHPPRERFNVWEHDETWKVVKEPPDADDRYVFGVRVNRTGRLVAMGRRKPPPGTKIPSAADMIRAAAEGRKPPPIPAVSDLELGYAEPPAVKYVWRQVPWSEYLKSIAGFALSPDATLLAIAGERAPSAEERAADDGLFRGVSYGPYDLVLFNVQLGKKIWTIRVEETTLNSTSFPLSFSPDGQRLLLSRRYRTEHFLIDVADEDNIRPIRTKGATPLWSPDSRRLAMQVEFELEVFSSQNGQPTDSFRVPRGRYLSHAFSRDSRYLAAGGDSGTVWLYRLTPK